MKVIIDIEKDYYNILKYNVEHGQDYKLWKIIVNGIPYEDIRNKMFFVRDENSNQPIAVIKVSDYVKMLTFINKVMEIISTNKYPEYAYDEIIDLIKEFNMEDNK